MVNSNILKYLYYFNKTKDDSLNTPDEWLFFLKKLWILKQKVDGIHKKPSKEEQQLQKLYLDILIKKIPTYQLSPNATLKILKRTKILWNNLKQNPLFEEAVYQYRFGDFNNKNIALFKIFYCFQDGVSPFFKFPQLDPRLFKYEKSSSLLAASSFVHQTNDQNIFINTDHLQSPFISFGHMCSYIYHETAHLIQKKLVEEKSLNTDFFDKDFVSHLDIYLKCYESKNLLKNLIKKQNKGQRNSIIENKVKKIIVNNPLEKEAYLCGTLIQELVHNYMAERNLYMGEYDENSYHNYYPFKNKTELLSFFGEKRYPLFTKKYSIPYDFFDRNPCIIDGINPYGLFNHSQNEFIKFLENPQKNQPCLEESVKNLILCLIANERTLKTGEKTFFNQLTKMLNHPIINTNLPLKKEIIHILEKPGLKGAHYTQNPYFIKIMENQKKLLKKSFFQKQKQNQKD